MAMESGGDVFAASDFKTIGFAALKTDGVVESAWRAGAAPAISSMSGPPWLIRSAM
jgi:hypothetical protein